VKTWNLPKIKIIKIFRLFNKKKTLGCNLSLLRDTIEQIERVTAWSINDAYVDLGYRGHDYKGETQIKIVNYRTMKKLTRTVRKWFKRRAAIEPIIGHVKSDHRMSKNYLKGVDGDHINAFLGACGFTMRKLIAVFFLPQYIWCQIRSKFNLFMKKIYVIDLNLQLNAP